MPNKLSVTVEVDPKVHLGYDLSTGEIAQIEEIARRAAETAVANVLVSTRTGDRPGPNPNPYVDTSGEKQIVPQGDNPYAPSPDPLVRDTDPRHQPTAGELRAAGYQVPDRFADEEIPTEYGTSTVDPAGAPPRLVEEPAHSAPPAESEPDEDESDEGESGGDEPGSEEPGEEEPEELEPPEEPEGEPSEPEANATPAAMARAAELGIDPRRIHGSGRDGTVTKGDVEMYAESLKDRPT
jgi:pyruvate/2-oxoglutarate dehydrogenase complex dihydrolipoamide acyltransferase (E2) component